MTVYAFAHDGEFKRLNLVMERNLIEQLHEGDEAVWIAMLSFIDTTVNEE